MIIKLNKGTFFNGYYYVFESCHLSESTGGILLKIVFEKKCQIKWTLRNGQDYSSYLQVNSIPEYKDKDVFKNPDKRNKRAYYFVEWNPEIKPVTESIEYIGRFIEGSYEEIILYAIGEGYDTLNKLHNKLRISEKELAQILETLSKGGNIVRMERETESNKNQNDNDSNQRKDGIVEAKQYVYSRKE